MLGNGLQPLDINRKKLQTQPLFLDLGFFYRDSMAQIRVISLKIETSLFPGEVGFWYLSNSSRLRMRLGDSEKLVSAREMAMSGCAQPLASLAPSGAKSTVRAFKMARRKGRNKFQHKHKLKKVRWCPGQTGRPAWRRRNGKSLEQPSL